MGPRYQIDRKEVEKIQRCATKLVPSLRSLPYEERLCRLKLPSLMHRRRRGDMIHVYKIMSGMDRIDPGLFFHQLVHTVTRGHSQKIHKKRFRLDVRGSFVSQRIVGDWNSLPENVIMSDTLDCFISRLDRLWRHEQYKIP